MRRRCGRRASPWPASSCATWRPSVRRRPRSRVTEPNPLRDEFRMHRVPGSCAVVIFGGLGDLAGRKLVPALYNLYLRRLLPAGFSMIGIGRTDPGGDEGYRAAMRKKCEEFSRTRGHRRRVGLGFAELAQLGDAARSTAPPPTPSCSGGWARSRPATAPPATCCSTCRCRPASSPSSSTGSATTGSRPRRPGLPPRRDREAVRRGPGQLRGAERRGAPGLQGASRSSGSTTTSARRRSRTSSCSGSRTASSSRSGTATSSTTSRSPWPSRSGSRAAAASTRKPARCATSSRTTCCRCCRFVAMEPPASFDAEAVRDERGKALVVVPAAAAVRRRARPVRGRPRRRQARAGLPRGGRASRPTRTSRPTSPRAPAHRQLALGRYAVLPPHRQAPAEARHRGRDPVQARAAPAVLLRGRRAARAERARAADPAQRGHLAAVRREGAVGAHPDPHRQHGLPVRHRLLRRRRPRRTRRCCSTRCAATAPTSPVRTRSRSRGASCSRCSTRGRTRAAAHTCTRPARGAPRRPTSWWRATAAGGGGRDRGQPRLDRARARAAAGRGGRRAGRRPHAHRRHGGLRRRPRAGRRDRRVHRRAPATRDPAAR